MTDRTHAPMRPSIRLTLGPVLRAIIDRWAREAHAERPRPSLKAINGGRQ